jgi:hypothetical protein
MFICEWRDLYKHFLKIDQQRYLAAGVYLSKAPNPLPPVTHRMNTYNCSYSHREGGEGIGRLRQINSWSIFKKCRHLGFGVFIATWSMVAKYIYRALHAFFLMYRDGVF